MLRRKLPRSLPTLARRFEQRRRALAAADADPKHTQAEFDLACERFRPYEAALLAAVLADAPPPPDIRNDVMSCRPVAALRIGDAIYFAYHDGDSSRLPGPYLAVLPLGMVRDIPPPRRLARMVEGIRRVFAAILHAEETGSGDIAEATERGGDAFARLADEMDASHSLAIVVGDRLYVNLREFSSDPAAWTAESDNPAYGPLELGIPLDRVAGWRA